METKKGVFKIRALVDLGAEASCIKRKAVLLIGGPISANKPTLLITPDGGRIYSYGDSVLRVTVADTHTSDGRPTYGLHHMTSTLVGWI